MLTDTQDCKDAKPAKFKWYVAANCHNGQPFCTWINVSGQRACTVMSSGFDTYRVSPVGGEAFEVEGDVDDARREAEAWVRDAKLGAAA
jgi:hypothetical protein